MEEEEGWGEGFLASKKIGWASCGCLSSTSGFSGIMPQSMLLLWFPPPELLLLLLLLLLWPDHLAILLGKLWHFSPALFHLSLGLKTPLKPPSLTGLPRRSSTRRVASRNCGKEKPGFGGGGEGSETPRRPFRFFFPPPPCPSPQRLCWY